MKDKSINNVRELYLRLFPAQAFSTLTGYLSGLVNGLITGNHLSSEAMVALGFVNPLTTIYGTLSTVVYGGAGILCGQYMGRGDSEKVDKVFSLSMVLLVASGTLLSIASFVFANPIALLCGASGSTTADTALYIRGLAIGIIPLLLVPCLMTFLQMCNRSNFSLLSTIALAGFNCLFGLLNVKVTHGGIFGVGLSTSLSYYATLILIIIYFRFNKGLVHFKKDIAFSMTGSILKYGCPSALVSLLYSIRNLIINIYALKVGGAPAVNALAILGSCGGFFDTFNIAVASTALMLASVFVGERDSKSFKNLARFAITFGVAIGFAKMIIIYIFGTKIGLLFGAEGEVVGLFTDLLRYYSWSMPINMVYVVLTNSYCAQGKVTLANVFNIITAFIVPVACIIILPKFIGITGIWLCYFLAEVITVALMYVYLCIKKKGVANSLEDILDMPKDFSPGVRYVKSIKTIEEVIGISKDIDELCKSNGIDKRRSYFASLCAEEMAGNIVEHGFIKDKKENTVDVFAYIENGDVNIRFRDNCIPFNPNERLNMGDDPISNIGIRMVSKIAKEMNYQTTFGLNVLTIRL